MKFRFRTVKSEKDLRAVYPVLKELRKGLSLKNFLQLYAQARSKNDYQMQMAFDNERILGLMGYRILFDFLHGKHLYIDDLVTTERERSKGLGAAFLQLAIQIARENGCGNLRLSTGIENELGKKFYVKNGWKQRAAVYKYE